jgi:hypothetical protein
MKFIKSIYTESTLPVVLIMIAAPLGVIFEYGMSFSNAQTVALFLSLLLIILQLTSSIYHNRLILAPYTLVSLFFIVIYALLSYIVVDGQGGGIKATAEIIVLSVMFYYWYQQKNINITLTYKAIYAVAILNIIYIATFLSERVEVVNYLRYTYIIPIVVIYGIVLASRMRRTAISVLVVSFSIYILSLFGGRYPIVFSLLVVFIYPMYVLKLKYRLLLAFICLTLIYDSSYYIPALEYIEEMSWYSRILYLDEGIGTGRMSLYTTYFDNFNDFILTGYGAGQTGIELYGNYESYPHNVYLHMVSEYGILGIMLALVSMYQVIVSILIYLKVKKLCHQYGDTDNIIILDTFFIILLYVLFLFMKSASMYDMYPLIGITIALYHASVKLQKHFLKKSIKT